MAAALWTYRARVIRVVDADTLDCEIDQGFRSVRTERLRLLGVDAPEMRGESRPDGLAATAYVNAWLGDQSDEWPLTIRTEKADAFGRYLARVERADGAVLNDDILAAGHAVPFRG